MSRFNVVHILTLLSQVVVVVLGLGPLPAQPAEPGIAESLRPFVDSGVLAGAVTLVALPTSS
jgi:hypothetical protein